MSVSRGIASASEDGRPSRVLVFKSLHCADSQCSLCATRVGTCCTR